MGLNNEFTSLVISKGSHFRNPIENIKETVMGYKKPKVVVIFVEFFRGRPEGECKCCKQGSKA